MAACGSAAIAARADDKLGLVTVDNEVITVDNLRSNADGLGPRGAMIVTNPATRRQLVEQMVDNRLIAREAVSKGIEKTKDYEQMLNEARINILANIYQRQVIAAGLTDAKVQEFFRANQKQFADKKFHAAQIQVKDGAAAATILAAALKPGADFATLAKAHSIAPGASQGGDMGWFARGRMIDEFVDAVAACPVGVVCPKLARTSLGYHIIKVQEVKGSDSVAFESVKDRVRQAYERRLKEDLLQKLRAKARIAVHEDALSRFNM